MHIYNNNHNNKLCAYISVKGGAGFCGCLLTAVWGGDPVLTGAGLEGAGDRHYGGWLCGAGGGGAGSFQVPETGSEYE